MSTSELFLDEEEIQDFIKDTKEDEYLTVIGEERRELGICPFLTLYIYHHDEDFLPLAQKIIGVYQQFKNIVDSDTGFKRIYRQASQVWHKANSKHVPTDLNVVLQQMLKEEREFWIQATDMESEFQSARWAINAQITNRSEVRYTTVKFTFRHKWYLDHKSEWQQFVLNTLKTLQPEQAYSGFEVGTTTMSVMGSYESDVMERICADYFYGLDVDHPSDMGFQYHRDPDGWVNLCRLGAGLRTPVWSFLLNPYWLKRLDLTEQQVRQQLDDPRIHITAIPATEPGQPASLWIQLGELALYPVEEGIPDLLVKASQLIKPVRANYLRLNTLDPWDDDPNPRFDEENSPLWMARFDEESQWPPGKRVAKPAKVEVKAQPLRCEAGQPCPKTGEWWSPANDMQKRSFKQGEIMPEIDGNDWGQTIWYMTE